MIPQKNLESRAGVLVIAGFLRKTGLMHIRKRKPQSPSLPNLRDAANLVQAQRFQDFRMSSTCPMEAHVEGQF